MIKQMRVPKAAAEEMMMQIDATWLKRIVMVFVYLCFVFWREGNFFNLTYVGISMKNNSGSLFMRPIISVLYHTLILYYYLGTICTVFLDIISMK